MAGQFTRLQKSYRIDVTNVNPDTNLNEIPLYRAVIHSGDDTTKLPTEDNQTPLGVVDNDERLFHASSDGGDQGGRQIAVKLEGIASVELADTVATGERVIVAAGGKLKAVDGTTPGQYEVLGFAERGGVAGDVIPVRMAYHTFIVN